jgi:hypothetical protein
MIPSSRGGRRGIDVETEIAEAQKQKKYALGNALGGADTPGRWVQHPYGDLRAIALISVAISWARFPFG